MLDCVPEPCGENKQSLFQQYKFEKYETKLIVLIVHKIYMYSRCFLPVDH